MEQSNSNPSSQNVVYDSLPQATPTTTLPTPEITSVNPLPSTPPVPPAKPKFPHKKLLISILILILVLFTAGISAFLIGTQMQNKIVTETPTPVPSPTPQIVEATIEPTPITSTSSPTPTPNPEVQTKVFTSLPTLDGFQSSNGAGNSGVDVRVGRNTFQVTRGFLIFDISSIPKGSTIESASLKVYQTGITGSPYSAGSSVKVDHIDYGPTFEPEDYKLAAFASNIATLTDNDAVEWKEITVTDAVRSDLNTSRIRTGFRLHFAIESIGGKTGGDFAYFEGSENFTGTGNVPQLTVTYK